MCAKNSNNTDIKHKIVETALDLAVERGWEYITLRDIAAQAKLKPAEMFTHIEDKNDILVLLGKLIDKRVFDAVQINEDDTISPRDKLFDILMDRFDALNDYRDGLIAVLESFKYDPKQIVISMPHLCKSMSRILEISGIETAGIKGAIKVAGLSGVYLKVLKTWMKDDTQDLSRTMVALDKALERAEKTADTLGF